MGMAEPQPSVGGWGPQLPQKLVTGLLVGNCYLENNFHKKTGWTPPLNYNLTNFTSLE